MLFNSIDYALFFPVVFFLYWFVFKKSHKWQNVLLLTASYFFYACWDWRFVFLLAFSTALDYFSGLMIDRANSKKKKKFWLILSVGINLGFLGFFKYYNFFVESFAELLQQFGLTPHIATLNVILPVGISFYTFHGLSYVFDIYNDKIKPTRNWIDYTLFVSFFPLLVAGPIERATHLLPQVQKARVFEYSKAVDGLRQILWGIFKKVVIADNCAILANDIFTNYQDLPGNTLLLGALFFTFQIYGDFSGYSDIALGSARLLGFELLQNFKFPYFSRDIAEFWRRWHVSLSSWFKDYLYIPLGGSRKGKWMSVRNTMIIFIVSGFWHGANWTFIAWGAFHGLLFLPLLLMKRNRKNTNVVAEGKVLPSIRECFQMLTTFTIVMFGWIFFRAESIHQAFEYIAGIFSPSFFSHIAKFDMKVLLCICVMLLVEWFNRSKQHGLQFDIKSPLVRWLIYISVSILFFSFGAFQNHSEFIYFQF